MVKLSERFSFQALTDALGSLGRFQRTDVTRRYERKQIILNVPSSALLGNSRLHVVSMTSNFLTLRRLNAVAARIPCKQACFADLSMETTGSARSVDSHKLR